MKENKSVQNVCGFVFVPSIESSPLIRIGI